MGGLWLALEEEGEGGLAEWAMGQGYGSYSGQSEWI